VHTRTITVGNLSEDALDQDNELRAVASLTPVLPVAVSKESPQVVLSVA
jgi:hypothetical protein